MTPSETMQEIQFLKTYARKVESGERRETWRETVERVTDFLMEVGGPAVHGERERIFNAILRREVSPSMRLLPTAGQAARDNGIGVYNCSYLPLDCSESFNDLTMLLGHGTGVGFSVEGYFVDMWPSVPQRNGQVQHLSIPDTIEGWAHSIKFLVDCALEGVSVEFDYSYIRPAGTPLKRRGGHASGPDPLREAHERIDALLRSRAGAHLRSADLLDVACHIASAIVSGGVRRSAMIAIFDGNDTLMLNAKHGEWWKENGQRALANISTVINESMTLQEWRAYLAHMDASHSGEPGIWSRYAIRNQLPDRRSYHPHMGPNPCVEQILRPRQLCNLSQAIARYDDTYRSLEQKVRTAALIGTIQSMITNFDGVSHEFAENCEDERLLGVSISGIMDCPVISNGHEERLQALRKAVISENVKWAKRLGIKPSTSTTCVKPDGNTSVLYDTAPGVHGRYAPYYIRRMRMQDNTPVANFIKYVGIPWELDVTNERSIVASFPIASPKGAVIQLERSAVEQLENWRKFKESYTETNPSVTITYRPEELDDIAAWLHAHEHLVVGLSFLPANDVVYAQTPYEAITEEQYRAMVQAFPDVDMNVFWLFENPDDAVGASQVMACVGGACEV